VRARIAIPLVVASAAAGPLLGAWAVPGIARVPAGLVALAIAATAVLHGFPGLAPGFRWRSARGLRGLEFPILLAGAAVLLLPALGAPQVLLVAPLLASFSRALRRPRPARDLRTLRDAGVAAFGMLVLDGGSASVLAAAAATLFAAAALPGIQSARPSRRTAGFAAPATAALALLLFLLLPRPWPASGGADVEASSRRGERPARERTVPGGLSLAETPVRSVSIGDIGRLQQDARPILEVEVFRGGRPADAEDLGALFRSGALESFDGVSWEATDRRGRLLADAADGRTDGWFTLPRRRLPPGEAVEQRVRFLAGGSDALFCLGMPTAVGGPGAWSGVLLVGRGEVRARETYGEGDVFVLRSVALPGEHPLVDAEDLPGDRRARLLFVPPGHEETAAQAAALLGPDAGGRAALRRVESFLARTCEYSLDIAGPGDRAPVEAFLFRSKRGHCELFASAAAVMLRSAGIPARVVIGFRGGAYDPVARRYTLRGTDAHAWAEAWLEGEGWVSFDPTPSAPGAPPPAEEAPWQDEAAGGGLWSGGLLRFDGGAQRRFVLGAFDLLGSALSRTARDPGWIGLLLAGVAALGGLFLLRRGRAAAGPRGGERDAPAAPPPSPSWAAFLEVLAARGIRRGPAETPRELAARAAAAGASPRGAPASLAEAFAGERWGGRSPGAAERESLLALARSLTFPGP